MKKAPIPKDELKRIVSLYKMNLLDTPPEERFDRLTKCATEIFHVPISTLTLIDANREWFKSCQGLPQTEGDRAISFCGHALVEDEILVVNDTRNDPRFHDNPMVTGDPHIRFYAGVPIVNKEGHRIGVFCIKDVKPREFTDGDVDVLKGLANWAELEINLRNMSMAIKEQQALIDKYILHQEQRLSE